MNGEFYPMKNPMHGTRTRFLFPALLSLALFASASAQEGRQVLQGDTDGIIENGVFRVITQEEEALGRAPLAKTSSGTGART